jgi:hypothetical protein
MRQQSSSAAHNVLDEQVIAVQLGGVGRCYSSLQRVLAVGAAAQLLLALQQPAAAAALEAAGIDLTTTDSSSSTSSSSQSSSAKASAGKKPRTDGSASYFAGLPTRQQQLRALLKQPLRELQSMVDSIATQQQQQQEGVAAGKSAAAAVQASSCASALLLRLQQVADGRQMKQWLPDIDTGRFMAGE